MQQGGRSDILAGACTAAALTTHWQVLNRAVCPTCGKPRDCVLGLQLGDEICQMSYGRAEEFARAILSAVEQETAAR